MKTENLKNAYKAIKQGKIIDCNGCRIWIAWSEHGGHEYIFWRSYGQSAERLGLQNLRWIMKQIAGSEDYSFKVVESIY